MKELLLKDLKPGDQFYHRRPFTLGQGPSLLEALGPIEGQRAKIRCLNVELGTQHNKMGTTPVVLVKQHSNTIEV